MRCALRDALRLLVLLASCGCESKAPDVTKVFPAPRLAALAQSRAGVVRYAATTQGTVRFTLADGGRRVEGSVPVRKGWLSVDVADLRSLEGRLRFDVSRVQVGEGDPTLDESAAQRALGLSDSEPTPSEASFAVTRILSATELRDRTTSKESPETTKQRFATLVVRGDLELRGRRAEREVELELAFSPSDARADGAPQKVSVRSVRPFRLALAPFGFPRHALGDGSGKLLDSAQLELNAEFMATPE